MFSEAAGQSRNQVPCVGVSVGIERVYSIMETRRKLKEEKLRGKETEVYIMAMGGGLLKERMGLAKLLRDSGIKVRLYVPIKLPFTTTPNPLIFSARRMKNEECPY